MEKKKDSKSASRVIQVSNISPSATREQIFQLFSFLGRVDEIRVYPTETNPNFQTLSENKLCYVRFDNADAVSAAQHMTNTVFIDRALICIPVPEGRVPDEDTALKTGGPSWPGQRQLPPNVLNQIQQAGDQQVVMTIDPTLAALGLPSYPPLPSNTEAGKIEEIRRTIYIGNLPKECDPAQVMQFFNDNIGEVMYLRMAGSESMPARFAYVEFSNQSSVPIALQNNGLEYEGQKLRIQHSKVAIIKPSRKTADMAAQEVEDAIKKQGPGVGGVGSITSSHLNRGLQASWVKGETLGAGGGGERPGSRSPPWRSRMRPRSRSRSPLRSSSRRRSRSRDRDRGSRRSSREKSRRSRSRERRRRDRSRSKDRKSSRRRSRSREGGSRRKRSSRSKSKERSGEKKSSSKDEKREREREKEKRKEGGERSSDRSSKSSRRDRSRDRGSGSSRKKEKVKEKEDSASKKKEPKEPPKPTGDPVSAVEWDEEEIFGMSKEKIRSKETPREGAAGGGGGGSGPATTSASVAKEEENQEPLMGPALPPPPQPEPEPEPLSEVKTEPPTEEESGGGGEPSAKKKKEEASSSSSESSSSGDESE